MHRFRWAVQHQGIVIHMYLTGVIAFGTTSNKLMYETFELSRLFRIWVYALEYGRTLILAFVQCQDRFLWWVFIVGFMLLYFL